MSPPARPWPLSFTLYRGMTGLLSGHLSRMALRRHGAMGASPERGPERLGQAGIERPEGPLVWINAASLGEVRAAQAVIGALGPVNTLLTTTTKTGAARAASTLPPTGFHQYAPLDTGAAMGRFLGHWRPDLAIFIESEVPMRAVDRLAVVGTPMAWMNVRPSRTRARFPGLFAAAMDRMALITAQDRATEAELRALGMRDAAFGGTFDLKAMAPPPLADRDALAAIRSALGDRPAWLVVSAHPDEAAVLAEAHRQVRAARPGAALILVPRHPERSDAFLSALSDLTVGRRSLGDLPDGDVYLADTFGEAGTFLTAAPFAVIGGTFAEIGGHSPAEAIAMGRPILHGPSTGAHDAAFAALRASGAARMARDPAALASMVVDWLGAARASASEAAARAGASARAPLPGLAARLAALLP